jgi:hypothetical protein
LILLTEFVLALRVSSQYSAAISLIFVLAVAIGVSGLELLALTVAVVYSSVFIILFVVILHFWSMSSTLQRPRLSRTTLGPMLVGCVVLCFSLTGPIYSSFSGVDGLDSIL